MSEPVDLKAVREGTRQAENEKMADMLMNAARRAKRGDFRSVAWFAWGADEYGAHFGWQKFGTIMPLVGAGFTMLQEMATSPNVALSSVDDEPELPL